MRLSWASLPRFYLITSGEMVMVCYYVMEGYFSQVDCGHALQGNGTCLEEAESELRKLVVSSSTS
eukprot:579542-Amphidinium_carterae.1